MKIFRKNFLFFVSQPHYYHHPTVCPHTKNVPRGSPLGSTVWEVGPPNMSFLQITIGGFSQMSCFIFDLPPTWLPCPWGIFCNIQNRGKRVRTPPKSTPKKSPFLWPTHTEFVGGPAPYPLVKRVRSYLLPIWRYGLSKFWDNSSSRSSYKITKNAACHRI